MIQPSLYDRLESGRQNDGRQVQKNQVAETPQKKPSIGCPPGPTRLRTHPPRRLDKNTFPATEGITKLTTYLAPV